MTTPTTTTIPAAAAQGVGAPVAFFDLDGTLIKGSANIPLAVTAFRRGFVTPKELVVDLRNGVSFILKGASDERSAQVRDRILGAVAGHPQSDVVALGDHFLDDLVAKVIPQAADALALHGQAGRERVILSASPTEIVSRLASMLGLEHGVGTTSEVVDGRYTGRLEGPFCYREGKADIMRAMADEHGWDLASSYAYSDSISDLPMLEAVGHPVAINPERELLELAQERGWEIIITNPWRAARKREYPALALHSLLRRLGR
jgi:HAD superfamily hydrolase (TIGR01490 family)